jgi:hypothetical protein
MDFKEVTTKKGSRLVFCDLKEFLMNYYKVGTIEECEPNVNSNGEYIVHCPFCKAEGHTKHKLYIKEDFSKGHCFVCTRSFFNVSDEINLNLTIPSTLSNFGIRNKFEVVPLSDPEWTLEKYLYECDDFDQKGYNYLLSRHPYMKDLYQILGFKFLDGNVVMPFKYHGNVFYYQIRFSNKNSKIRYFFPPIASGCKPPYIIEHGNLVRPKIIVCEGVYDAISLLIQAPSYIPFAVMGSHVSDYQLEFLREYTPSEIVVYMDDTEKSQNIANRIKSVIDYCPIYLIKSDGEDPEERMVKKMKRNPGSEVGWIDGLFDNKNKINFNIRKPKCLM